MTAGRLPDLRPIGDPSRRLRRLLPLRRHAGRQSTRRARADDRARPTRRERRRRLQRPEVRCSRRLRDTEAQAVDITVDGRPCSARAGDTVAAALLAAGIAHNRTTPVSGAPRAPYCMMGVCFDCLVTIDGVGNRQACLVLVRDGMKVETQQGKREGGR